MEKNEEFARILALGLWDYMRKSRSRGFVVSLSGGADSSTVACLVAIMVKLVHHEIGLEKMKTLLSYYPEFQAAENEQQVMPLILSCIYQGTQNSSNNTLIAAKELAESLACVFDQYDIDSLVTQYRNLAESTLKRPLSWASDDLSLQNIQARTRAPSVWLLANAKGAILLTTSNRSEAAVGYTTMDGDTCGGLSPIGGVDKAFIIQWLKWMELEGFKPVGYFPILKSVNAMKPTAELRPKDTLQTDEQDLMPYDVLDRIERLAIRDKLSPLDCYRLIVGEFQGLYDLETLKSWVKKFFVLWSRNQWKRERLAPSFHLDDENLDPKTWCRWPILSGGFHQELQDF
jgi:NAD+ synthase (glutamine-hydrolysing)